MRNYRIIMLVVGAALAVVIALHAQRKQTAPQAMRYTCATCTVPAKPTGSPVAKPPAIPARPGFSSLLHFTSAGSSECRRMAPVIAEVTRKLEGRVDIIRIDTEAHPELARRWRLRLIPTQIMIDSSGSEVWRHEGYLSAQDVLLKVKGLAAGAH